MLALDLLKKHRVVMASLPTSDSASHTVECVMRRRSVDMVEATFLPGQLPVGHLDLEGTCRFFFQEEGRSFRLRARIEEIAGSDRLILRAVETALQYGEREYFRVNAEFAVRYRRLTDDEDTPDRLYRGLINLSGGGLLLPLKEPARNGDQFSLTLILRDKPLRQVECLARVVRVCPLSGGFRGAGLHFTEIETSGRDAIIGFCMAAQRLELRNKVQTRDLS